MVDAVDEGDIRCLLSLSQTLTQRDAAASCLQTSIIYRGHRDGQTGTSTE
jgi:hypothetical protein